MATDIFVRIILDSISPEGKRLTTMHWHYPRFIHSEVMTHRLFSRNARSSRAVPGQTLIAELMNGAAVIPLHWGAKQKGMQADFETNEPVWVQKALMPLDGYSYGHSSDWEGTEVEKTGLEHDDAWWVAVERAVQVASAFMDAGYHKQVYNRILEPFLHIDTLVTATEFENFLWLRDHKDAEPHIKILAQKVKEAMDASTPTLLQPDEWHLPYITPADWDAGWGLLGRETHGTGQVTELMKKISAARCARISYKPFDGNGSIDAELARYESLISSDRVHASPVEHQATPDTQSFYKVIKVHPGQGESIVRQGYDWNNPGLHGNFSGWIQYRKTIPNEAVW